MKAGLWLLLGWLALACGGDAPDHADAGADAYTIPGDATFCGEGCNIVAQTGCDQGQKCGATWESLDPPAGELDCVPGGLRSLGQSCAIDGAGVDDCVGGLLCYALDDGGPRCFQVCEFEPNVQCDVGSCMNLPMAGTCPVLWADYMGLCVE